MFSILSGPRRCPPKAQKPFSCPPVITREIGQDYADRAIQSHRPRGQLTAGKKCTCEEPDWDGEYWKQEECLACTQGWEQHSILWRELRLKPWQWPVYERAEDAERHLTITLMPVDRWRVIGCSTRQRKHNQTKRARFSEPAFRHFGANVVVGVR
jgi:hypothetical protein